MTMDDDERLRKNNERLLKIGFKKYQEIHQIIGQRIQKLEEQAYGWLDDILEEAREAFGKYVP